MELLLAQACAQIWRLVDSFPPLKRLERNVSGMWGKSQLLNHPYVKIQRGFVFIHVPKAAGTSLREALGLNAPLKTPSHARAQEVVPFLKIVAPAIKAIAFVRNPYSRFLSLYNFARQEESLYHSASQPDRAPYGRHIDYDILRDKSLEQCAELLIEGKLGGDGYGLGLWQPQVKWLIDRHGKIMVDYIGHVESLDEDLQNLKTLYGITSNPVPWLNVSAPTLSDLTFNERARELVRIFYRRDFEMLGYDENDLSFLPRADRPARVLANA